MVHPFVMMFGMVSNLRDPTNGSINPLKMVLLGTYGGDF
jgi:hypothetical protein